MATSSMDLIKLMVEPPTQLLGNHVNKEIAEDIQFMFRHNPSSMCNFSWVQIIGNQAAHNLASWGFCFSLNFWLFFLPLSLPNSVLKVIVLDSAV